MASYKRSHRLHSQFAELAGGGCRFFSPREVARAQGFPARFRLDACNNAGAVYAQLGNAVPPPLACAVLAALLRPDSPAAAAAPLALARDAAARV